MSLACCLSGLRCLRAKTPCPTSTSPSTRLDEAAELGKTANRGAEYAALKERLRSGIASGRDTYDAVAEYLGWFDDSHLGTEGVRAYRPKSIRRPSDYAARMERYDPQFTHCRVDGETYLIRFPSCDLNEEQAAWVRTAVRAYLASGCENLILDIRGNGGGSDSAYEPLLRLLYDHEGAEDAMEYRVSDLAVAHVREFAGDTERGRGKIARMERTPAGEFLTDGPKTYRIHYDSVSPRPRRAGLLIDGKVGSSGEQLVLEVRASSRRTTVYGQDNTLGCLDFSNCEILYFPQDSTRWMMLPTTRSCRVSEGRGIDSAGIAPDVRIPLPLPEVLTDNVDAWTLWVAEDMKTEKRKEYRGGGEQAHEQQQQARDPARAVAVGTLHVLSSVGGCRIFGCHFCYA